MATVAGKRLLGTDFRLSWETVSSRTGFYHGLEIGALVFVPHNPPPGSLDGFTDTYVGAVTTTYTVTMRHQLGIALALAKYGYRHDFGSAATGLGLAAELGIGARIADGYFNLEAGGISGYSDRVGLNYWDSGMGSLGFIMDTAAELNVRIGNTFRFFIKPGLLYTDRILKSQEEQAAWNDRNNLPPDGIGDGIESREEATALVSRYELTLHSMILSARLGFTISY